MKRLTLGIGAGLFIAVLGFAYANFKADMRQHSQRLTGWSQMASTQFGRVEFAVRGKRPPFLMIHGTGRGFDQGLTFTERLAGYRVIWMTKLATALLEAQAGTMMICGATGNFLFDRSAPPPQELQSHVRVSRL